MEAHDPAENHWRSWRIKAGQDLFEDWVVEINFGRSGTEGQTLHSLPGSEEATRKFIRAAVKRRDGAPKRIGIRYELRELIDPHDWLADLL